MSEPSAQSAVAEFQAAVLAAARNRLSEVDLECRAEHPVSSLLDLCSVHFSDEHRWESLQSAFTAIAVDLERQFGSPASRRPTSFHDAGGDFFSAPIEFPPPAVPKASSLLNHLERSCAWRFGSYSGFVGLAHADNTRILSLVAGIIP